MKNPPLHQRIHETADVHQPGRGIGERTLVWNNAIIERDVYIGSDCVIGSNVYIGENTQIGNNVRIQHGAFICRGAYIYDNVFIGPNATLTDDKYPRAGQEYYAQPPTLEEGCSIGAGAIILPGIHIGKGAMVGAGAVVTANVRDRSLVSGVPAQHMSFHVNQEDEKDDANQG